MSKIAQLNESDTIMATPTLSDLTWICHNLPHDEERQFLALSGGDEFNGDEAAIGCFNLRGPKWVMLMKDSGMPLGAGGYFPIRPGVWQSWMLVPQDSWESHGKEITEIVDKIVREMTKQGHRLQTLVLSDRTQARLWYGRIGLEQEATLRAYGANGEDFEMYSIVTEEKDD